jgi:hypothetical protein
VINIVSFSSASDPGLLRACQALRYRVYHHDLGLDMPDLDHAQRIDAEERDASCDFVAAVSSDGAVLGCLRMQPPGRGPYYADREFVRSGSFWDQAEHVEGARFVVTLAERGGPVPLLLFQAFRRYCRELRIRRFLSVVMIPAREDDRQRLARLCRYLGERVDVRPEHGHPRPGYELAPPTDAELHRAGEPGADELPPMLQVLATPRSTLCAPPAYCRRFGTFDFLLSTRLA